MKFVMNRIQLVIMMCCMGSLLMVQTTSAQNWQKRSWALTPSVGVMFPLADVVDSGALSAGSPAASHNTGFLLGGKLDYWWSQHCGVGLELMYAPNEIDSEAFLVPGTVDATFWTLSARFHYDIGSDPTKTSVILSGGVGLFFTEYDNPLDMTTGGKGLIGIGLNIPFSSALALRFDLTDYFSTTNWELAGGGETDKLLQNDLTIKGGLTFSFGRPVR